MGSAPVGNVVVVRLALPPTRVALPRVVGPLVKVTVPVGVAVVDETVAVNFRDCPEVEGFFEEVRLAVVMA